MRGSRSVSVLVTAAALVAACGSTAPTPTPSAAAPSPTAAPSVEATPVATPVPTTAPTSAPSPSPSAEADVAAAFNKTLTDPLWSPHITIKAVSKIGAATVPMTGTMDLNLGTTHTVISYGSGAGATTDETISNGSVKFTRKNGAWFKSTDTSHGGLGAVVTSGSGFTDAGVEAKDGRQLHHMVLPSGTVIPAAALGVPANATNTQVTLEAWADSEGTPATITVTASWSQPGKAASVPVSITMDMVVDGAAQTINAPTDDDLWQVRTSTIQHMQLAVPATWEYTKGSAKKADIFEGYDGSFLGLARAKSGGASLNEVVSYARKNLAKWSVLSGAALEKASAATLGGQPARILRIHGKYKGTFETRFDIIAVKNGYIYELVLEVPRKPTADDLAMWQTFLATFAYK
jgi:hypothetical protein